MVADVREMNYWVKNEPIILMYISDPAAAKKIRSKVVGVNGTNWDAAKKTL